ncbi:MAG: 1-acyl-sn-glycerol-3-phosphate acyltransferase [Bacteroidota bacterium]
MYYSKKNTFVTQFFTWYISYILRKDFSAYHFNKIGIKPDEAVLLLANHFSWWDGFLLFQLNKLLFRKRFHVLIGHEDYCRHWYLKYLGSFAAENNKKDVVETLIHAGKLLDDPANLVLVFPQGKSRANPVASINFEKGIIQLINSSKKKFQIVFSASFADYYGKRKPTVNTYLAVWEAEEYMSLQLLKSEYNKHYNYAIRNQDRAAL